MTYNAVNPRTGGKIVMRDITEEQYQRMKDMAVYKALVFKTVTEKKAPDNPVGVEPKSKAADKAANEGA